jgi:CelD/BcsL family acetyltransferase involved in cellulose biosynthesis
MSTDRGGVVFERPVSFSVEQVSSIEALREEWERLVAVTSPRLPFAGPLWNALWWHHFREDRSFVRDSLRLYAIRDQQGTLRGVAPMMLTERPAIGPVRARMLQFLGADPNVTEVRGVVCTPQDQPAVIEALLHHLELHSKEWDWLFIGGILQAGDAYRIVNERQGVKWGREVPDFLLAMPHDFEVFKAGLSRNIKESLRKCYNSLKRDNLEFTFHVLTAPSQMDAALDHFLRLHSARAAVTDTITHKDVFDSGPARAFLRDFLKQSAAAGAVRVFQLEISGKIVATRIGFVLGDALYLYFSGFDPDWGKYSVMTTTVAEALKFAVANKFATVNLSPGNDVSKTRWGPSEVMFREAVVPSPSFIGPLVYRAYVHLNNARHDEGSRFSRVIAFATRRS